MKELSDQLSAWWNGNAEAPSTWFVYILYDDDKPVYIGKTNTLVPRLSRHRKDPAKQCVSRIEVVKGSRSEIEALEIELIQLYKPLFNRRGLGKCFGYGGITTRAMS